MPEPVRWYDITGASVTVLDETAQWFRTKPAELRSVLAAIVDGAGRSVWRGPRAETFNKFVDEISTGSLGRLEVVFAQAADLLDEQARQQRDASAGWTAISDVAHVRG